MSTMQDAAFTLSRVSLELVWRRVRVRSMQRITPGYLRVELAGDDLAGFDSPGADDHIRLFFPQAGAKLAKHSGPGFPAGLESREFTPVAWDGVGSLTVDIALHPGGVATPWAEAAEVGAEIYVGGPRGALLLDGDPQWWLLAGDLTALPAIRRFLTAVTPGTPVDVVLTCDDSGDRQQVTSTGDLNLSWVHPEPGAPTGDTEPLIAALGSLPVRGGDGFAFIAAEQSVVAPGRAHLKARGVGLERAVVKGYWKRGHAEYHAPH